MDEHTFQTIYFNVHIIINKHKNGRYLIKVNVKSAQKLKRFKTTYQSKFIPG